MAEQMESVSGLRCPMTTTLWAAFGMVVLSPLWVVSIFFASCVLALRGRSCTAAAGEPTGAPSASHFNTSAGGGKPHGAGVFLKILRETCIHLLFFERGRCMIKLRLILYHASPLRHRWRDATSPKVRGLGNPRKRQKEDACRANARLRGHTNKKQPRRRYPATGLSVALCQRPRIPKS